MPLQGLGLREGLLGLRLQGRHGIFCSSCLCKSAHAGRTLPDLAEAVVRQTVRRVLKGETVPADEKVVSLFEPHTDIIRKGGRRVQYGHKVNLGSGASGLVFDAVVEAGNPADSSRCLPMIGRHAAIYGSVPEHVACDGGYASKANLAEAKAWGCTTWSSTRRRASRPRTWPRPHGSRGG